MTPATHLDNLLTRIPELQPLAAEISRLSDAICTAYRAGGKVLVCGNGGSAADCEHIVGELMKGFVLRRALPAADVARVGEELAARLQQGIPAISLTGHPALSTAVMNDTDAEMIFAQQAYVLGKPGDVLLGISTSGNARNVANALQVARAMGMVTAGLTGSAPARIDPLCDILLKVPTCETYRVQEYHLPIYHTVCLMVEAELFG